MDVKSLKKYNLPDKPGVYFFKKGKTILYIGKATSLKDRTKSYFSKDPEGKSLTSCGAGLIATRGPLIVQMVKEADKVDWLATDSVLEALILEAELIKKHQPKYNVKEKDDKSFNYVCITKENVPRIIIKRGRDLKKIENNIFQKTYGPFTNGLQLKEALRIIRKIFPFLDDKSKNNYEFYKQLKLVPENKEIYNNNIKNLKLFFEGKKKKIIVILKKEMISSAKIRNFERANEIKKKIFALEHINDVALIKQEKEQENSFSQVLGSPARNPQVERAQPDHSKKYFPALFLRIEAYDVAHMSGKNMVGVMTVIERGELAKNEYKKFIIRTQSGTNDTGALEEILSRRFRHLEWGLPNLVVVDGSVAQINVAKMVLNRYQFKIPVVGVVKDERHKAKAIQGDEMIIKKYKKLILLANSEAHRFAIKFYRVKSRKNMFTR